MRGCDKLFGGICVVFSGDWRQTLPIIQGGSEAQIVHSCLKFSKIWDHVSVHHLVENMRVKMSGSTEVENHSDWLLRVHNQYVWMVMFETFETKVGEGRLGEGELLIPEEMRAATDNLDDLVNTVFPSIDTNYSNGDWVGRRAIISPSNKEVDEVNLAVIKKLPGDEIILKSIDSTEEGGTDYPPEFLNTVELSGIPPHSLVLKPGCLVMLLRNIDQKSGHCNGVKYVVVNIRPHVLELRSVGECNRGATILLPRIISISKTKALPFTLRRKQFPVKLAYGMTANKVGYTFCSIYSISMLLNFDQHLCRRRGRPLMQQDSTWDETSSATGRFTLPSPGSGTQAASR